MAGLLTNLEPQGTSRIDFVANPAVTLARGFKTTFAGIKHVPAFIIAQLGGRCRPWWSAGVPMVVASRPAPPADSAWSLVTLGKNRVQA
jgi:hypothetical protein